MRRLALVQATAGLALLALSACQDPSTVGLGLLDDDASNPNVRVLNATSVDTVGFELVTSGLADLATPTQSRVLVGNVVDALFGDATATAYVDAIAPTLPSGFGDRPVTRVTLELRQNYVYGDTTAALPVELREVSATWSPTGLPADTTLATGELLTTNTVGASDTLTGFTLPAAWVAANDSLFTSASFSSSFEGFELRAPSLAGAGAVVGFNVAAASGSVLRVATARDTVSFRLSEVFSRVTRGAPGLAPMGRRLLRAGVGEGLRFAFDYAGVRQLPLAQAVFRLPIDRTLAGPTGTFVRPLASEVALFARPTTGDPVFVTTVRTAGTGDARSVSTSVLTSLVQTILLDQASYRDFQVRFPTTPVSLDVLPLVLDGATPATRPRLSLTVVGQPT